MSQFHALESHTLAGETALERPHQEPAKHVGLNAPAHQVVTDLSQVAAMTIGPCASIDEANDRMIAANVRLLFVTDQHYHVMGLVTARDVNGERAVRCMQAHGGKRADLMVRDVMTPRHHIEVLEQKEILKARVGDVVETLRRLGRQHALVVKRGSGDELDRIAGIISTTQVARQTGESIESLGLATSLADLAGQR